MSLRINTNLASINAQRAAGCDNKKQTESATQKTLSSGSRITKASDDAAGLAISENFKAHKHEGTAWPKRNAEDAISFIQVGEGSLNEINNILVRMRELGVQSASDTIGDTEREFIDQEAQQLLEEVDRIAQGTRFGDKKLLDGSVWIVNGISGGNLRR